MRHALTAPALLAILCTSLPAAEDGDIVIADFEGKDYGDWKATGDAFGSGPVQGTLPNQLPVSGFEGKQLVNSYLKGDGSRGTLTSGEFTVARRHLNFLIGGGNHPDETCIQLLLDDKVVRTATGPDDERLDWRTWDVSDLLGKKARIRIVDSHSGGWGHINIDSIILSEKRLEEPIVVAELYNETYRPQFHFTPKVNWTNDPNGLVYYKGEYHFFFQHNPKGINWGNMTWGHAVSPDLLHWEQLPNAIEPDRLGTIFSGSAVVDWRNTTGFEKGGEKAIVAIYTSAGDTSDESKGQPFTQSIAYSTDRGRTWTKYAQNPVLPNIVGGNRDPKVVWHAPTSRWIMALYKDGNRYALFSSPDLKAWTHLHDLTVESCGECPDFFEMPVEGEAGVRKWVFTAANGNYLVGSFDGKRFTPEAGPHRADWGKNYYAVQTYSDVPESDGRRIQIAWMNGGSYPRMPFNQQMSFPCALTMHRLPEGLRLYRNPVREIEGLRSKTHRFEDRALKPGENPLASVLGDLFEIRAEIEPLDAAEVGLKVRGESIRFVPKERKIHCLGCAADMEPVKGRIRLQVLVDRASIEVFGNDGGVSMTSCFVPRPRDRNLEAFAVGGTARIVSLEVHELRSVWRR